MKTRAPDSRMIASIVAVLIITTMVVSTAYSQTWHQDRETMLKTRSRDGQSFPLASRDLAVQIISPINSSTNHGITSDLVVGSVLLTRLSDPFGHEIIPSGSRITMRYTADPAKPLRRHVGAIFFDSLDPIDREFIGEQGESDVTPGMWRLILTVSLRCITIGDTGKVACADDENRITGKSTPSQASRESTPPGLYGFPGGPLIYGIASIGERIGKAVVGKKNAFIPAGSTFQFRIEHVEATYLGPSPSVRVVPQN